MSHDSDFLSSLATGYAECGHSAGRSRLLLAVSGGADSMALLYGTVALWFDAGSQIAVAHVNHQLRGDHSQADVEFVRETASRLGVTFFLRTANVIRERDTHGGTLEEVARRTRYQLLRETAEQHGYSFVVCAHHQDDQAETILHNIIRGTGLRGLSGMPSARVLGEKTTLLRPLLKTTRRSIQEFLTARRIDYCADATNTDESFTRNRIRQRLLPLLTQDFNPQAVGNLVSLAEQSGELVDCLDAVADRILSESLLDRQPDVCRLSREALRTWPAALIRHALTVLWQQQQWPRQKMTRDHWKSLADGIVAGCDRRVDFPGSIELVARENLVRITRTGFGTTPNSDGQGQDSGESEQT